MLARTLSLVLIFTCSVVSSATARSINANQIPNAASTNPDRCFTCHTINRSGPLNAFGLSARATFNGQNVDWPRLCELDSDNDGASNGVELGDPNCSWREGLVANGPVFDPSNPAIGPATADAGEPDAMIPDVPDADVLDGDAGVDQGTGEVDTGNPRPTSDGGLRTGDDPLDGGCGNVPWRPEKVFVLLFVLPFGVFVLRRREKGRRVS